MTGFKDNRDRAEELRDKLRRVLPFYEARIREQGIPYLLTQIEMHLYGIELLSEEQVQEILTPYIEQIEEQIEAEAQTVTYLIQVRIETNMQTGKIEDVRVFNSRSTCNYMDYQTPEAVGEAVTDFIREYLPEVRE